MAVFKTNDRYKPLGLSGGRDFYAVDRDQKEEIKRVQTPGVSFKATGAPGTSAATTSQSKGITPQTAQPAKKTGGGGSYTVNAGTQPYVDQLNSLYDQIMNRKPFQYDLNGDLLYRQMADRYTQLGQQAMRDTMGQAAALTGGYGNSYANQVGNQAYQQYLTALNDNIPQLWDRAYQVYQDQGDQLMQQYQLAAAHPEYVNALAPRTYSVSAPAEEEEAETPASNQAAYDMALMNAGLLADATGVSAVTNPFNNYYYELLAEEQKKK